MNMIMEEAAVRVATPADEDAIIATLVLAFSSDPAARWAFPDPAGYLEHFPEFVRLFGGKAFEHGSAYFVGGYAGGALWLPPGTEPDQERLEALLERAVPAHLREDLSAVFDMMGRHHPSEPHWYLPLVGVDSCQQGRGYGSALLRHALWICDRDRKAAYLESTNTRNIPLYERHGFELVGTIQVGSSPPIFPMLRRSARF